jgi:ribA/ribD-fused uncharacterized protein
MGIVSKESTMIEEQQIRREQSEEFIFFWGGECSQWYKSDFVIDKVSYNCAEQYMMAEKAVLFNDFVSFNHVMSTNDPQRQKAIGRSVKNFDQTVWEKECKLIVYRANWAKFTQNPELKQYLMATGKKLFVEASPHDTIWGIGLGEGDPRCHLPQHWKGTNWLGEIITKVRDDLRTMYNVVL